MAQHKKTSGVKGVRGRGSNLAKSPDINFVDGLSSLPKEHKNEYGKEHRRAQKGAREHKKRLSGGQVEVTFMSNFCPKMTLKIGHQRNSKLAARATFKV